MEGDQNGRRPKCKTTKMEDDQNERRPKLKSTKMEDQLKEWFHHLLRPCRDVFIRRTVNVVTK